MSTARLWNPVLGSFAFLVTLTGIAWAGSSMMGVVMRCHPNCNNNLVNCDSGEKPCCCGGGGGTYGFCSCKTYANCQVSPNCIWGDYPTAANP